MHILTINSKDPLELVFDDSERSEALELLQKLSDHAIESGYNHEYEFSLKVVDESTPLPFTVPTDTVRHSEEGWQE